MTDVNAPKISNAQVINAIYGHTNDVWTPGISFPGGPDFPESPNNKDLFIKTPENHLRQYQDGYGWADLGATSDNLVPYGTSFPTPTENALFNKLNEDLIYQRIGTNWISLGSNANGLPTGTGALNFYDPNDGRKVGANLYLIITEDDNPLLATDQGFIVKKDISVGGFVGANQGELWLGHGRANSTDVPKILLMHAEPDTYSPGYSTLYIKQRLYDDTNHVWTDTTPGHLDLGNLTAHGNLTAETQLKVKSTNSVFAVTAGDNGANQDTYLIPQNPSQGGLGLGTSEHPFKFVDTTSLFTTSIQNYQTNNPPITINSTLAFGNNPFTITNTNTIANLNADLLDGHHASDFLTSQWNGGTITNNIIIQRNYPYVDWYDSSWSAHTFLQTGIDTAGGGGGTYMGLQLPTGKGFFISANSALLLETYAGTLKAHSSSTQLNPSGTGNTGLEIGNSSNNGGLPFIDFHFGINTPQDYNVRLINNANGILTCYGQFSSTSTITATNINLTNTYAGIYSSGLELFLQPRATDGMVTIYNTATNRAFLRCYEATQKMTFDALNVTLSDTGVLATNIFKSTDGGWLQLGNGNVITNQVVGLTWHGIPAAGAESGYGIFRTAGAWNSPYAQLKIRFDTGIILDANAQGIPFGVQIQPNGGVTYIGGPLQLGDSVTRLYRSAPGVIQVQNYTGGQWLLGTFDASNVFTDHINSASGQGIYIMDVLKGYTNNTIQIWANVNANGTYLTSGWGNNANATQSEISNDIYGYYALMIVGNSSGGGGIRRVKMWDELTVNGSEYITGNWNLSGTGYLGNDLYLGTSVANDAHIHRAAAGVLQCLDASGYLGTWESSNIKADHWTAATGSEMYFMNHMRAYSALNIMPNANNSGNIGGNGAGTNYYWGAVYANYIMYHSSHTSFDHVNDLDLVKSYTIKMDETGKSVIDDASLPFLRDAEGFFRPDRVNGFLLGCAKATAIKHDEQDGRVGALLSRIEALENQLQAHQTQA